jgi:hypothetical protein
MSKRKPNTDEYKRLINDMLTDNNFNHASGYLRSVKSSIEKYGIITDKQAIGVNNIYMGKSI